ncbi:MAG: type II secretion system protein GspK, partial [Parvularculaceae bacterium]
VVRPFLCAHPTSEASVLNLNMLRVADAPLLVAVLEGKKTLTEVQDLVNARPPGGYEDVNAFWANAAFAGVQITDATKARVGLSSRYLEVNAAMKYYDATLDLNLFFEVDGEGRSRLIARRFGRYE